MEWAPRRSDTRDGLERKPAQTVKPSAGLEPATPSLPWRIRAPELAGETALVMAFFLQLRHFVFLAHPSLDEP
jgi:hypothetical protein